MASGDYFRSVRLTRIELGNAAMVCVVAAMIAVLFAGSTILTPLYVMYQQQFGFSKITLTLVYAAYVIGNLAALLVFGKFSDEIGRRRTATIAMVVAILGALSFLLASGVGALYAGRILSGLGIGIGAGTGTAWLSELIADKDRSRASIMVPSANFIGLGIGAVISGVLAEYGPYPLELPFLVYLLALLMVTAMIRFTRETVARPARHITASSMRPRVSVPSEIRARFVAPAVTGFAAMALVGFYAALAPSLLADQLHETSHAAAGAIFLELSAVVAISIVATQSLSSRAAMLWALALMPPSVLLVVAAQASASMSLMIVATALCGVASGLGYRGSLQVVNQIAPPDRRAEVVSSYFICGFCGNALPVIGIGVISTLASPTAASLAFAATIILFALIALVFAVRYSR